VIFVGLRFKCYALSSVT